jgi:hypothetical protein
MVYSLIHIEGARIMIEIDLLLAKLNLALLPCLNLVATTYKDYDYHW